MGPQDYTQPNELELLVRSWACHLLRIISEEIYTVNLSFPSSLLETRKTVNTKNNYGTSIRNWYHKASVSARNTSLKWLASQTPTANLQFWKQLACVAGGFVWVSWRARAIQNSQPRGIKRDREWTKETDRRTATDWWPLSFNSVN